MFGQRIIGKAVFNFTLINLMEVSMERDFLAYLDEQFYKKCYKHLIIEDHNKDPAEEAETTCNQTNPN